MTAIALKEKLGIHNVMVCIAEPYYYITSPLGYRSTTRQPTLVELGSSAPSCHSLTHSLIKRLQDNSYPGSASDTPAHFYVPSTHLNPHWTATFPPQTELLAYWRDLASRYTLYHNAVFQTRVLSATWNDTTHWYDIDIEDVRTGERRHEHARFVVSAVGLVSEPRYPETIKGIDSNGRSVFEGAGGCWHSARWRHDIDFHGQKVAVIGNSASA